MGPPDESKEAALRRLVVLFVAFLALQAGSAAVLFVMKHGLTPGRIVIAYRGAEAAFAAPRSLAGMLEVAVPHLLAVPLVVFVAAHLALFLRPGARAAGRLAVASFATALAGITSAFGVRYLGPALAWLKLASFVTFEVTLLAWIVWLIREAMTARRGTRTPAGRCPCSAPARRREDA